MRERRPGASDSSVLEEALQALLADLRRAEIDASYREAYDRVPFDAPDAWGDLASFGAAADACVSELPRHGEVWWCELPDVGRRPVVVLSRDEAVRGRRRAIVAPCTTNVRGLPSEVLLEPGEDPVPRPAWPTWTPSSRSRRPRSWNGSGRSRRHGCAPSAPPWRSRSTAAEPSACLRHNRVFPTRPTEEDACRRRECSSWPTRSRRSSPRCSSGAIKDPRLGFVTVTDVRLTGDSREATVFYTVLGGDADYAGTAAALQSATGLIRSQVGKQLGLKFTPTLAFIPDVVPESARQLDEALAAAREGDARVAQAAAGATYAARPTPTSTTSRTTTEDDDVDARRSRPSALPADARPGGRVGGRRRRQGRRADLARGRRAGPPAARHPQGRARRARSTRWPPACWSSASSGPRACSATSR